MSNPIEFVHVSDNEFRAQMLNYIQDKFGNLLSEEDRTRLANGDEASLAYLSDKIMTVYRERAVNN
jgi:hypothetical protein